jgi:hypothetical protein
LDETDEAPRMTQLPRVESKSAFHFWSAIVGAELARGQLDVEAPQLERSSSEDEWWETSATGAGSGSEHRETATAAGEDLAERVDGPGDAADQDARDVLERAVPAAGALCGGEPGTVEEEGGGSSR